MRATNERLTILSEAEQVALYGFPDFDDEQRLDYLLLTKEELALVYSRPEQHNQIYCALQIGYFKAKQFFFHFSWKESIREDVDFILQHYFPKPSCNEYAVTKHEHYVQRHAIAHLFGYHLWSSKFESLLKEQAAKIILRDTHPSFIVMELFAFLQANKIIRPRYTRLQIIISDALAIERKRLAQSIHCLLNEETKIILQSLLVKESALSKLAVLKQDAKDFKYRMMSGERQKLSTIEPLYQVAKTLLSQLKLSKQNVDYYASLIDYYTIYDLRKKIKPEQAYLYLLCYIFERYQKLSDNLVEAFCYHLKQFDEETKQKAKTEFFEYQLRQQNEFILLKQLAQFYVDEKLPDTLAFGEVRAKAFSILLKENFREKIAKISDKTAKPLHFKWPIIDKMASRFKTHLRPILMTLSFTSITPNNPWLAAIEWLKSTFIQQAHLHQQPLSACPDGTLPKRLQHDLLEVDTQTQQPIKLRADRYEFWIYRQLRKRINTGELYIEDSHLHRSLLQDLVVIKEKETALKELNIPALQQPFKIQLNSLLTELHERWLLFNGDLCAGKLKHLRIEEADQSLHMHKLKSEQRDEELQHNFYAQLPLRDITDVLRMVNEHCQCLSALQPLTTRYGKSSVNTHSLIAVIIAQAMNHGNLNMAEISDIPYHILQEDYQSCFRLATLKAANDIISNSIASMPIFPFYSLDLSILFGGVDGQKYEVAHETTKARYSKKYFGKMKGVVAYTLLCNHIPLQLELLGAHEHESYYVFDIWHHNTSVISPTAITGDMHCINKANFALMHWFGAELHPRFTHIQTQLKHLYSGNDISAYEHCFIKPVGKIDRTLIEEESPNLQRIIATLGLKEIKQSTLIKKLCTYTQQNRTRKALFEFDKIIRSLYTLKYLHDPKLQRNIHRSQNRIEAYHPLRAAIAQAYGTKQLSGRTDIAIAISNECGRLIANAIIHYNSLILSKVKEKYAAIGDKKTLEMLKKISPVAWRHIHFLGHYLFSDENKLLDLDALIEKLVLG